MRRSSLVAISFVLGTLSVSAAQTLVEAVVAFVDDELIFASELNERLAEPPDIGAQTDAATRTSQTLDRMIDELLIRRVAEMRAIRVSDEEVARAFASVRAQNGLDQQQFSEALVTQGFTTAEYEVLMRRQLLRVKVLQYLAAPVHISESELRRAYHDRIAELPPAERLSFDEARDALYHELMNPRVAEQQELAMQVLRDAAYIERRIATPHRFH